MFYASWAPLPNAFFFVELQSAVCDVTVGAVFQSNYVEKQDVNLTNAAEEMNGRHGERMQRTRPNVI